MELSVLNNKGNKTDRKVKLDDKIFGVEPNDHAIYLDVKQYQAFQRHGKHSTRERNRIAGSTKKIKRQKGTGTARSGDIKSPIFRGGGRVFGPEPRKYGFRLNKKIKRLARYSALTYKARNKGLTVLEDVKLKAPKTKEYDQILGNLKVNDKKTLVVLPENDKNLYLSSRNIPNSKVVNIRELNTYDIMNADHVIFLESSVAKIPEVLK